MKRVAYSIAFLICALAAHAQEDPEYRAEVGAGAAMTAYQGDFSSSIFKNLQPMGSLVAKYRFNPRMAMALNISYGKLKGSSQNAGTYYPATRDTTINFSNPLVDTGLRFEYNFWPYGTGKEYRGAQRLTPFIFMGIGMSVVKNEKSIAAFNLPIGAGVKYKVADRLNLTLDWTMHFSATDQLDGLKDPYGIKSTGLFKNTDCYSVLQLSLTYDIWAKCKICNNDRN